MSSNIRKVSVGLVGVAALGLLGIFLNASLSSTDTNVSALSRETHFHGIAVDRADPNRVFLATHHGLFAVSPDGSARLISNNTDDYMGFTPHPTDPNMLYASGHPAGGGNLGFLVSKDGGKTWSMLATGAGGPVDFHQMDVSKANPEVIYGVFGDLQKSTDGGRSWRRIGPVPERLIGLAASSKSADRIYAATQHGLLVSTDGGRRWKPATGLQQPATMVHVTSGGTVYAFVIGSGLIRADEADLKWTALGSGFGSDIVLHLAASADPDNPTLYAVTLNAETRTQTLHVSSDGGQRWKRLGAEQQ